MTTDPWNPTGETDPDPFALPLPFWQAGVRCPDHGNYPPRDRFCRACPPWQSASRTPLVPPPDSSWIQMERVGPSARGVVVALLISSLVWLLLGAVALAVWGVFR